MKKRRKKTRIGKTGCLFWLLILLIVVIIFLYKGKGSFKEIIGYFKDLNKKKVEEVKLTKKEQKSMENETKTIPESPTKTKKGTGQNVKNLEKQKSKATLSKSKTTKKVEKKTKRASSEVKINSLTTSVYFIKIDLDGSAKPYPIKRVIHYKDSPITMTINTLLKGPTSQERKKGIISFIPKGTKLLSASIKNGHLVLNFNDSIEENYSGRDAILLELSQILYTCFEYEAVKSVSILLNGKRKQYITGEGIPLKAKYNRNDLSSLWD